MPIADAAAAGLGFDPEVPINVEARHEREKILQDEALGVLRQKLEEDPPFNIDGFVKAQGRFIHAQHAYIMTNNTDEYLKAQSDFIVAQNIALHQLGII
jgi:hypothetical protein